MTGDTLMGAIELPGGAQAAEELSRPAISEGFHLAVVDSAEPYLKEHDDKDNTLSFAWTFLVNPSEDVEAWDTSRTPIKLQHRTWAAYINDEGRMYYSSKIGGPGFSAVQALEAVDAATTENGSLVFDPEAHIGRIVRLKIVHTERDGEVWPDLPDRGRGIFPYVSPDGVKAPRLDGSGTAKDKSKDGKKAF